MAVMMNIDLDREGWQRGTFCLDLSNNASTCRRIETPIISVRNGQGPRILCLGGVHGDEYLAQITWTRLARRLVLQQLSGQLIIVPAANVAAAMAGTRTSPVDGLDLNRIFPGSPDGTPTERVAHWIEHDLIAQADFLIDLHSGSSANHYLPGPTVTRCEEPERMARLVELLEVFGAPQGYVFEESRGGAAGTLGATRRRGIDRLGSEIGGGGAVPPSDLAMMEAGVIRILIHLQVLDPVAGASLPAPSDTRVLRRLSGREGGYLYSPADGLFEPRVEVGATLARGELLGLIHRPERPDLAPMPLPSPRDGVLMTRRRPGRTRPGDCLLVVAGPYSSPKAY